MIVLGQAVDESGSTTSSAGAVALRRVAELVDGRELTPVMGRWLRRLAATFSSWHAAVVRALEGHPALTVNDPFASVEVRRGYLESVLTHTRGLGPRVAEDGVVPVAVAIVELAGSFGHAFSPLEPVDPELHEQLTIAADLAPAPFGTHAGVTSRFIEGVVATVADVSVPGLAAGDVRHRLDVVDVETIAAIESLRRAASNVVGCETSEVNNAFDPARVAALAAVLHDDEAFIGVEGDVVDAHAHRIGPAALAATGDFAVVARPDERIAAGLTVADRRHVLRVDV